MESCSRARLVSGLPPGSVPAAEETNCVMVQEVDEHDEWAALGPKSVFKAKDWTCVTGIDARGPGL